MPGQVIRMSFGGGWATDFGPTAEVRVGGDGTVVVPFLKTADNVRFTVDGGVVDFHDTVTYRAMMFTGVPNLVWVFGYFRTSWTVRVELVAGLITRLLNHMQAGGYGACTPQLRDEDQGMTLRPWFEQENISSGYIMRGLHLLPKQGDRDPWIHTQEYYSDRETVPADHFDNGALVFEPAV